MSRPRQPAWLTPERRERLHAIGTRLLDGLAVDETHEPTLEEGVDKAQKQLHGLSKELLDAHARISELDGELSHLKTEARHGAPAQAPAAAPAPAAPPSLSAASAAQVGEILALLEDQVIGFEQRLAAFDAALASTREHAGALERRITEAHGEAARLREESEALRRDGEDRERELESTTSALESALVDLAELQSKTFT